MEGSSSGSKIKRVLVPNPRKRFRRNSLETNNNDESNNSTVYLPIEIVDRIFTFLPIESAITSSSLVAKPYRHSWLYSRNLCFDKDFRRRCRAGQWSEASIVNYILQRHLGDKISNFKLYTCPVPYVAHFQNWFKTVASKGVEDFQVELVQPFAFCQINSDIFTEPTLRVLKLVRCELFLSQNLSGLQFLKSLSLSMIPVSPSFTKRLFSSCLLLEYLALEGCCLLGEITIEGLNRFSALVLKHSIDLILVTINTPSITTLHYSGKINKIKFVDPMVIRLKDVILDFGATKGLQHIADRDDLLQVLRDVETLSITNAFLEGLSTRFVDFEYRDVEYYFQNLKELQLVRRGLSFVNPWDILCFVKNCPNIERLFIDFGLYAMEVGSYWNMVAKEKFEKCQTEFPQLKLLKVKRFKKLELEEKLVKYFLLHATSLESLILLEAKNYRHEIKLSDIIYYKTVSNVATVSTFSAYQDQSRVFPKHTVLQ
ncbi:PREDICTED: putative FBD-associated F-box protein At1g61330 [Nicotiana attenuata]|uniref:putative FBD-associated F-box protein At1g61330 n=1 Tax=Nicotiana attenuata TaxID=49451 RepID=UPI000904E1FA|nr:PREDICTED: putative FBD-associated F-box protein At1g61330 [Nicotiana attenuata]